MNNIIIYSQGEYNGDLNTWLVKISQTFDCLLFEWWSFSNVLFKVSDMNTLVDSL